MMVRLVIALLIATSFSPALAQTPDPHAGHTMPAPAQAADPHSGHRMPAPAADPHAGHTMPSPPAGGDASPPVPADHAAERFYTPGAMATPGHQARNSSGWPLASTTGKAVCTPRACSQVAKGRASNSAW